MLTLGDFKAADTLCPFCGRPAKIYERNGENYLRCLWPDCRGNKNGVPSAVGFCRAVEEHEAKSEAESAKAKGLPT